MRNRSLLAPLALVGAIFVAIAVALYFYAVPRPLWTTSSPKLQKGIEFLGVYKGTPRHLAKHGFMGGHTRYKGDLWAYFQTDRTSVNMLACRIVGRKVATKPSIDGRISTGSLNSNLRYSAFPVPDEYVPELQNGKLVLSENNKDIASWQLQGMPTAKRAIDPAERYVIKGEALGYRVRLKSPYEQFADIDPITKLPTNSFWQADADISAPKNTTNDRYELSTWIMRTSWGKNDQENTRTIQLPRTSATITLDESTSLYIPTDRLEQALRFRQYRMMQDSVVLKDVVCERTDIKELSRVPGELGYELKSCSNASFTTPGGLRMRVASSSSSSSYCANMLTVYFVLGDSLENRVLSSSPLSRSTNRPIDLYYRGSAGGTGLERNFMFPLPFKSGPKTVKLPELKLVYYQKAIIEEKTIRLVAPVKLKTRIP